MVNAPFPINIHEEDGKIYQMSQTLLEMTGYSADQVQTLDDWLEKAYGKRKGGVLPRIQQLYPLHQRVDEGEFTVKCRDETVLNWLFSSTPLGELDDGT